MPDPQRFKVVKCGTFFCITSEVKERLRWSAILRTGCPSADVAEGRGGFSRPALTEADQGALGFS